MSDSTNLTELTIKETARLLRLRAFSAAELVTAHAEQIERLDRRVKAFLRFTPELWEQQAAEADRAHRARRPRSADRNPDGGEGCPLRARRGNDGRISDSARASGRRTRAPRSRGCLPPGP